MLSDVLKLTKQIYREILQDEMPLCSPISLYDSYRALCEMIGAIHVVAAHYLARRLDDPCLQNSSFGEPIDKWRFFLNKDLEELNKAVKAYLLCFQRLAFYENKESEERIFPLDALFSCKSYYGFVKHSYNVGHVNCKGTTIQSHVLVKKYDPENSNLSEGKTIDVSTYEKRLELKHHLDETMKVFQEYKVLLEHYLESHYGLTDLLIPTSSSRC